jgi:mono/diheme cytochrome c family protein
MKYPDSVRASGRSSANQISGEMHMKPTHAQRLTVMLVLASFVLLAFPSARSRQTGQSEGPVHGISLDGIPEKAQSTKNPFAGNAVAFAAGEKLYRRHCAECHGDAREGRDKAPALSPTRLQQAPPGAVFWILQNGKMKKGMPSWSRLSQERLWQIVTYLRESQKAER